ncbi:MAG: tetratricopeptide repeat protein [Bacteroidetes bacterium]|nr:tetratricopeptide repeat protein [Bacteroidota bacterium]
MVMASQSRSILHISGNPCKQTLYISLCLVLFISPLLATGNRSDSIKISLREKREDTAAIQLMVEHAGRFDITRRSQIDSSLFYLTKALTLTEKTGYPKHLYSIYDQFCQVFSKSGNFSIALDYYFKMLQILDDAVPLNHDTTSLSKKYAGLYASIGTCYFNMDNNLKALEYYRKSLEVVKKLARYDKSYPVEEKLAVLYGNIGSACLNNYNFSEAKYNFEKALELSKFLNNPKFDGSLYNNLGIIYKEKKDYEKAFQYYNKSLEIRLSLKDTAAVAQTYNNMGDSYFLTGNFPTAIDVLNKALKMSILTGSIRSQMKAANFLSLAYEKTGDYRSALTMSRLFKTLHDSIISNEQVQNTSRLELQYQYEKQRKENELRQEIQLAKKERKALIYMTLSGILLLSFVILFLLNRNQRIKMKQGKLLQERLELKGKNLTLEKQNLQMEKQNLELELEFRNKELSTHVMYLLKKNEFISSIINKMLALKSMDNPENIAWIQDILREMQSNVDNTVWGEFELRFQQVHRDFYLHLLEKFPDLTPNEIKICAFLKLNMTTKDISAITFQSVKSIQVARNRLRKKMGISRDENLVSTIQQL